MSIHLINPRPGAYKKASKSLIISVLTYEHPLSLKQIFEEIRRKYEVSLTYPAIRKGVVELAQEKVLRHTGKAYELNPEWITEVCRFVDSMQTNYLANYTPLQKVDMGEDVTIYTMNSIYDAELLWGKLLVDWTERLNPGVPHISTFQTYHLWILLFHLDWEEKQLIALREKKTRMYAGVYSKTFLDKMAVKFYNNSAVQTKNITDGSFTRGCELGTYDDMIIQLYHPPEIAKEIEQFYSRVRRVEDIDLAKLSGIARRKVETKLSVFKNAEMANQIRSSLLGHFPNGI